MLKKVALSLFVFLTFCSLTKAQSPDFCETTLNRATEEFNAGHFSNISSILNECLDKFSREQRERAYLLLAQTYLLLDDPFGAEQSYLSLLKANPEFVTDENRDPIEVVYLSKKFTATPIFSWYMNLGTNVTAVTVLNAWSSIGGEKERKRYSLRPGLQFGGGLEYNFNANIAVGAEVNYALSSYKVGQYFEGRNDLQALDRQNWINVPLFAKYVVSKGKIRPYAYGGYAFNILVRDMLSVSRINESAFTAAESPSTNYTDHRTQVNRSFVVGGGLRYKFGLNYFFADARVAMGTTNLMKRGTKFSALDPIFEYGYVEDDIRLNTVFISVGYVHPLYKPRKLKKARTKSVLKKIDKHDETVEQ